MTTTTATDKNHPTTATSTTTPQNVYFSIPEDPSYVYPVSSFPSSSFFEIHQEYPALIIPAKRTAELRNTLSCVILHRPKIKSVVAVKDPSEIKVNDDNNTAVDPKKYRKLILDANNGTHSTCTTDIWETNETLRAFLQKENEHVQKSKHTVSLGYQDLTVEETLRQLLPVREIPSAFEIIGHIAHVNLREELLPFQYIVGKAILDKNKPRIQIVVNKVGSIDTEFRTFGMKVIATTVDADATASSDKGTIKTSTNNNNGNDDDWNSIVTVREEKCKFQLDFRTVYWNSRLGGEHRRLVQYIRKHAAASTSSRKSNQSQQQQQDSDSNNDVIVVADLMAGVGPFAVPLTSTTSTTKTKSPTTNNNITVYANDLNPESYKYLKINSMQNKCENLHCSNMDARAFVHDLDNRGITYHHVIMNLPASAPEFLDAFRGFPESQTYLPRVHVHCFATSTDSSSNDDDDRAVIERCSKALGCSLDVQKDQVSIHIVRDVAPKKNMLCVSFNLPDEIRNVPRLDLTKKTEQEDTESVSSSCGGERENAKDNNEEPPCKKSRAR